MFAGKVRVTTVDEDQQEVVVDEPSKSEFFGLASMLEQTPHRTTIIILLVGLIIVYAPANIILSKKAGIRIRLSCLTCSFRFWLPFRRR
jgi:CRP-like cAMP-binding protein